MPNPERGRERNFFFSFSSSPFCLRLSYIFAFRVSLQEFPRELFHPTTLQLWNFHPWREKERGKLFQPSLDQSLIETLPYVLYPTFLWRIRFFFLLFDNLKHRSWTHTLNRDSLRQVERFFFLGYNTTDIMYKVNEKLGCR